MTFLQHGNLHRKNRQIQFQRHVAFKEGETSAQFEYSPTNYQNKNMSTSENYKLVICNNEEKGSNCKTNGTITSDESMHVNKQPRESLEYYRTKDNIYEFPNYQSKETNKKLFKRDLKENGTDPWWNEISPIGKKIENKLQILPTLKIF